MGKKNKMNIISGNLLKALDGAVASPHTNVIVKDIITVKPDFHFENEELANDHETLTLINKCADSIYNLSVNSYLELGKELTEVHDILAKKGYGCYRAFLNHIMIDKSMDSRVRRKWELFSLAETSGEKELVAKATTRFIDMTKNSSIEEVLFLLESKKLPSKEEPKQIEFFSMDFPSMIDKIKEVEEKLDKNKIEKFNLELMKLINKYS